MLRSQLARACFVAAIALLATTACGDDATETTIPPTTTVAAPATTKAGAPGAATTSTVTTAPPTTEARQVIEVAYRGGKIEGGGRKQVTKGRPVTLRVSSDTADEIHVHGYDKSAEVAAGGTAEITFDANVAGVFEVELHKKHLKIVDLEVK